MKAVATLRQQFRNQGFRRARISSAAFAGYDEQDLAFTYKLAFLDADFLDDANLVGKNPDHPGGGD